MPKCKNDKNTVYTGKEKSPKGLGYSAKTESIGTKKKGKDNKIWIVKKNINGVKLWSPFSSSSKNKINMKGGVGEDAARIIAEQIGKTTTAISGQMNGFKTEIGEFRGTINLFRESINQNVPQISNELRVFNSTFKQAVQILDPLNLLLSRIAGSSNN